MKLNLSIIIGIILIITAIICYVVRGDIDSIYFGGIVILLTTIIISIEIINQRRQK